MGRRARREESAHSAQFDLFARGPLQSVETFREAVDRSVATSRPRIDEAVQVEVDPTRGPPPSTLGLARRANAASVETAALVDADVDALVVPTTSTLRGTTPIEVAIRARAGRGLGRALDELRRREGGVLVGDVVATPGFGLRARHVIFVVPPRRRGANDDEALRAMCVRVVEAAHAVGACSLAVDVASLLRRGFGFERSAPIVVAALMQAATDLDLRFVVDDPQRGPALAEAIERARLDDAGAAVHTARRSV